MSKRVRRALVRLRPVAQTIAAIIRLLKDLGF